MQHGKVVNGVCRIVLALNCVAIYALLLAHGNYDWGVGPIHYLIGIHLDHELVVRRCLETAMMILPFAFYFTDVSYWIYLIVTFIPFEFTKPFQQMPSFTPLDYICTAVVIAALFRFHRRLWVKLMSDFRVFGIAGWLGFWVYTITCAYIVHGSPRASLRWVGFCFLFFLTAETVREDGRFQKRLMMLLTILGTVIASIGLYQFIEHPSYTQLQALFGQHNTFAAFLSLCLPAQFINIQQPSRFKQFKWIGFILTLMAFILSYSRGAWVGIVAGIVFVSSLNYLSQTNMRVNKWHIALLGVVFLTLCARVIQQPAGRGFFSDSERVIYLKTGWNIFLSHPWIGLGPGRYATLIRAYIPPEGLSLYFPNPVTGHPAIGYWVHLHNLYLQMLVDYGLIGFIFWGAGFGVCIYEAWLALSVSTQSPSSPVPYFFISIVGFLIHNCVDIVTVNSFDMLFGVLLAVTAFSRPRNSQ